MIDKFGEWFSLNAAERISRRDMIYTLSKKIFALFGIAFLSGLPVNRASGQSKETVSDESESIGIEAVDCSLCRYCGINGRPCESCSGSTGQCVGSGNKLGSYWYACCCSGSLYKYQDCCGPTYLSCDTTCRNSSEPDWCSGAGAYRCTVVSKVPNLTC